MISRVVVHLTSQEISMGIGGKCMQRLTRSAKIALIALMALAVLGSQGVMSAKKPVVLIVAQREPDLLCANWDMRAGAYYILPNIQSKLFDVNENFEVIPDLAEKWSISPDGTVYTVSIRKGVKFHHGPEVTAHDVKWNYDTVIEVGGPNASLLKTVKNIQVVDKYTVAFNLSEPSGVFLSTLAAYYGVFILPKDLYEGTDVRANPYNRKPVGTGPFKFVEWQPGSHITLEANNDYFAGRPEVDRLVFRFMDHLPTALAALEKGEVHTTQLSLAFGEIPRLQKMRNLEVVLKPDVNPIWMGFNLMSSKFSDVRVRRAVAHAINRDAIAAIVFKGLTHAENSIWLSAVKWASSPDAEIPSYDVAKANKLLDEAGFKPGPDGVRFDTKICAFRGGTLWGMPETADFIREQLKQVGIRASVQLMDLATWQEMVNNRGDFELAIAGGMRGPDPGDFAIFVGKDGARNAMRYENPKVEELFRRGARESDPKKRAAIYFELQKIVAEDLPLINTTQTINPYVHRTEFTGFPWQEQFRDTGRKHFFGQVRPTK